MFDKTDKKLKLDEETEECFKEIEDRVVDKKRFMEYFSYEPAALVNNLLTQNTEDLRKNLDEIKQQKIKLNEDERNSTNNKDENDELNNILSVINRIYQFSEYKLLSDKQPTQLKTEPFPDEDISNTKQSTQLKYLNLNEMSKPLWIKISKDCFISLTKDVNDKLDNKVYQTKVSVNNYNLKNAEEYLQELITKKISKDEALKPYNDLIKPGVDALKHAKGKSKNKRNNILNILNNVESSLFDDVYFHFKDAPKKIEYEKSIAERAN